MEPKAVVGMAGTVVGTTGVCVGADSVVGATGAQELNRNTNRRTKAKWNFFILPPSFS